MDFSKTCRKTSNIYFPIQNLQPKVGFESYKIIKKKIRWLNSTLEKRNYIDLFNSYNMLNVSIRSMPHYKIIRCEANNVDCARMWDSELSKNWFYKEFKPWTFLSVLDLIIFTSLNLYLVTLTEYGFCIADRTVRNEFHRDQEGHIHGTNMTSNKVLGQGFYFDLIKTLELLRDHQNWLENYRAL